MLHANESHRSGMSMIKSQTSPVTIDDLAALNGQWAEVVDGHIVNRRSEQQALTPGFLHNQVAGNIYAVLRDCARGANDGYACTGGLEYVLKSAADAAVITSRVPDVSFICKANLPASYNWNRPFIGAPDLAIEVVAPEDTATDLLERIDDYLQAGTREVWVVYPIREELYQYRKAAPATVRIYQHEVPIDSPVLPNLSLTVEQLLDV